MRGSLGPLAIARRLNGMFAMALWERGNRRLHLMRDRLGKKSLYHGWMEGTFLFGSELKSLAAHSAFLGVAAIMREVRPDSRFVVVGGGPEDYAAGLKALRRELGLTGALSPGPDPADGHARRHEHRGPVRAALGLWRGLP